MSTQRPEVTAKARLEAEIAMRAHFELGPGNYRLPTEEHAGTDNINDSDTTNTATGLQQWPPPKGQQQVLSTTISTVIPGPNRN